MIPTGVFPEIKRVSAERISFDDIEKIQSAGLKKPYSALLKTGRRISGHRYSIFGFDPFVVFRSKNNRIKIYGNYLFQARGDPFEILSEVFGFYSGVKLPASIPICPGAIGAFSYDLKNMIEKIPVSCEDAAGCPDMHFAFFRNMVITDELSGGGFLVRIDAGGNKILPGESFPQKAKIGEIESDFSEKEYIEAVSRVREYIIEGDIYQANISQQFCVEFEGDGLNVFKALDEINPAQMSAYLDCGDFRLISSSPERFLLKKGSRVESRPIKGTRPRGASPDDDEKLKRELLDSEKDRAELAMIVDLVRNDLGKTAAAGSVKVKKKRILEKYPNVFHSLAVVCSQTIPQTDPLAIIKSCFPGGSVTGCPKVQAMKVIEETEKHSRSFYCGSIGYITYDGDFDLNIAIRTFIQKGGFLRFNLGGGIVYDSDPKAEYKETMAKGMSMFRALKSSLGVRR